MARRKCGVCGGSMKGHGRTAAGKRRWQCMACGATTTRSVDTDARSLALFLSWLLSKRTQSEMGMSARTFRRLTAKFWSIWPIAPVCDEVHHVVHVDGIWLKRRCVVLIACTRDHIIGWHLARSESARAWAALMARIAPPDVVVTDGGDGFEKARRAIWPGTRVQRCTFHAFEAVKRCTTTRPRTQAGVDLYAIAKGLTGVESAEGAAKWLVDYAGWCDEYEEFLKERAVIDGRAQYRHERLRKARRSLNRLIKARTLFTYLDPELTADGPVPATNNRIEGGVNRQIRVVLNEHRGMRLDRMIKAVFWYCHSRLECPMDPVAILREMPTDETIDELYRAAEELNERDELVERWGVAVSWSDLHSSGPLRSDYD